MARHAHRAAAYASVEATRYPLALPAMADIDVALLFMERLLPGEMAAGRC